MTLRLKILLIEYPAYMYSRDQGKVRYWTEIWLGGAGHDVAFEEIID
jgi:hypothetical protein